MEVIPDRISTGDRHDNISTALFELKQNVPNPFNPVTEISYSITRPSYVKMNIYNIYGQRVKILVDRFESEGIHTITWDSTDDNGREVSSGIYFYQLSTPEIKDQKKMLLVR